MKETQGTQLSSGRPFRKKGRSIVAPLSKAAGATWAVAAQQEHASIAAFASLVQDLMAAGAPLDLIERTLRAALDEVTHTRACLDIHKRESGEQLELKSELGFAVDSSLPLGFLIKKIQIDSERDGIANEGRSAVSLEQSARQETRPWLKAYLSQMAEEEKSHAALAQDIVTWCRTESHRLSIHEPSLGLQK
jgi:hypothetical protein